MFHWLFLAINQCGPSDPRRQARGAPYVPYELLRRISAAKLIRTLRLVYRSSAVQRERWEQAGIRLRDIRSPEVLSSIPFCDPDEVALSPEAYFCVPAEELTHIITTSGTSGRPKKIYLTTEDVERQAQMIAAGLCRLPGASRVMAMLNVTHPTWSPGAMVRRGIEKAGMLGLLSGSHLPVHEQIKLIKEYGINVLVTGPTHAHRFVLEAEEDLRKLGVKYLLLSSQPWSEELREMLEEIWGAKALDAYATNECACGIASECVEQNGLHVGELNIWVEIIDPATGKVLPDGEEGEVVVTTLSRRGMPLVRYRTGDLAHYLDEPKRCGCGLPMKRLSRIRGRLDDVLIIGGGTKVHPSELDRAILSVPGVTDYQLEVEREGYRDVAHLTVECEGERPDLREELLRALLSIKSMRRNNEMTKNLIFGRMRAVSRGKLSEGRPKSVRVLTVEKGLAQWNREGKLREKDSEESCLTGCF